MKKLMMFAAAMTIVGGAYAGACAPGTSPCDTPVWDLTMSGKTANGISKGYKAVYAISFTGSLVGNVLPGFDTVSTTVFVDTWYTIPSVVSNAPAGVLAWTGFVQTNNAAEVLLRNAGALTGVTVQTLNGVVASAPATQTITTTRYGSYTTKTVTTSVPNSNGCCLDNFTVYLYDKATKSMIVFTDQPQISKMSVFGTGLEKYLSGGLAAGSSTALQADILWTLSAPDVELQFVGFGTSKVALSKGKTSDCGPDVLACEPTIDWPAWNGWFTGFYLPETDFSVDMICANDCIAVAGGTWSAKYNKSLSNASNVEAAIFAKFKVPYIVQ